MSNKIKVFRCLEWAKNIFSFVLLVTLSYTLVLCKPKQFGDYSLLLDLYNDTCSFHLLTT